MDIISAGNGGVASSDPFQNPGPYPTNSGIYHSSNFKVGGVAIGVSGPGNGVDSDVQPLVGPGSYPTSSDIWPSSNFKVNGVVVALSSSAL